MAEKYHIRKDETLGVCDAKPGNCPISSTELGEPFHGTREEVVTHLFSIAVAQRISEGR